MNFTLSDLGMIKKKSSQLSKKAIKPEDMATNSIENTVFSFPASSYSICNDLQMSKSSLIANTSINTKQSKKKTNELHKRINIFTSNSEVGRITYRMDTQIKEKKDKQPSEAKGKSRKIIYLNTFYAKNQKKELQQYILSQKEDFSTYIGKIQANCEYVMICEISLNAQITYILTVQHQNASIGVQKQESLQRLLVGCRNGDIYALDIEKIHKKQPTILDERNIIKTKNKKEENSKWECSVTGILQDLENKNQIYVVIGEKVIRRFIYEIGKNKKKKKQLLEPTDLPSPCYQYEYVQYVEVPSIQTKSSIKVLKYIEYDRQYHSKKETCLLIYIEGMYMPCVLNSDQIGLWFPHKLNVLVRRFNRIFMEYSSGNDVKVHYLDSNVSKSGSENEKLMKQIDEQQQNKQNHQQKLPQFQSSIQGIEQIQYKNNQIIIGCYDGAVHICSLLPTQKFLSQINPHYSQNQSYSSPAFSFIIEPEYAFKQSNKILSLAILQNYSYCCVSTSCKILFIDLENRKKFSQTLKQKQSNVINCVKWTINENLLLCSIGSMEGKIYAYSNQLPIRNKKEE